MHATVDRSQMMIGGSELTRLSQYLHREYKTSLASMTSGLDIYRTANVLIREHGEDAALEAAQRTDAMLEKGALDGKRLLESSGTQHSVKLGRRCALASLLGSAK
jgi:hypothetical protein